MSDTSVAPVNGMNGGTALPFDFPTTFAPVGTDFKPVALGIGANLEPLPTYFGDPLLQTGNLPGVAISAFNNRALRQGTFVASSLCLWISDKTQVYVPDDGNQINWQALYNQALAAFIGSVLPPGPNLGAYLPLSGGTMVGHINFQTGISTILSNNTWYYGRDASNQPRGLILKGSDNNVYINDGSASYIFHNGTPVVNNNTFWAGRDTAGAVRGVIGLLSDNAVHIGDNARPIFFDCGGASAWCSSNIVIPNNFYYYCKLASGAPQGVLGFNTSNQLLIGSGAPGSTDIYGPGNIYLHNTTVAYGQFNVNGYLYSQGGARCYIPGGNDPLQIYADNGYYARLHYVIGGVRDWSEGALNNGTWALADESAHAVRLQVDFNGTLICLNALQVNGGFSMGSGTVNGNLTVTNTLQVNNFASIYGGLTVQSGGFVAGGAGQVNGGLTVYNGLNVQTGNAAVSNGSFTVNGNITVNNTLFVTNQAQVWNHLYVQTGDLHVQNGGFYFAAGGDIHGNTNCWNGLQVWGYGYFNCNLYVGPGYGFTVGGQTSLGSQYVPDSRGIIVLNVSNVNQEPGIRMYAPSHVWSQYVRADGYMMVCADESIGTGRMSIDPSTGQVAFNTVKVESYGYFWARDGYCNKPGGGPWWDNSDERLKKDIKRYETGLDAIRKLRPVSYKFNGLNRTRDDDTVYQGLIAQEVMKIMPEMIFEGRREGASAFDDPDPTDSLDSPLYYVMNGNALTYALINAVQELAAQLDALKGK